MLLINLVQTSIEVAKSWVVQVFALVLVTAIVHAIEAIVYRRLKTKLSKTHNHWDDTLIIAVHKPLGFLIWIVGVSYAADVISQVTTENIILFKAMPVIRELALTGFIVWSLIRFIKRVENSIIEKGQHKKDFDRTSVNAIAQILSVSVLITGALIVLTILGIPLSGVLAFSGFGGIAVGFAAKDSLANFFGGMMIYLDKPFKVGDWIRSPDRNIEGTVEYIGWRLTRIRTFDKRPLYVPNAVFSTVSVENASRMTNRRIRTTIGVRYDDAMKISVIVEDIEQMLKNHEEIDQAQTTFIRLVNFGASSLDLLLYTFTKTTDWVKFQAIQEDVFLKIIAIINQHGAECAFPTTTMHVPEEVKIQFTKEALT